MDEMLCCLEAASDGNSGSLSLYRIVHCCLREVLTAKYRHVSLTIIPVRFIICARFGTLVA
jgi:hypothetical protein